MNFRDAGGWELDDGRRMRSRHLYRCDDPVRLTARGRYAVRSLGIGFVVDLRQRAQAARGAGFLPIEQIARIPLVDRVIDPTLHRRCCLRSTRRLYDEMLDRSRQSIADVLDHVAAHVAAGPVSCTALYGKDRAGCDGVGPIGDRRVRRIDRRRLRPLARAVDAPAGMDAS